MIDDLDKPLVKSSSDNSNLCPDLNGGYGNIIISKSGMTQGIIAYNFMGNIINQDKGGWNYKTQMYAVIVTLNVPGKGNCQFVLGQNKQLGCTFGTNGANCNPGKYPGPCWYQSWQYDGNNNPKDIEITNISTSFITNPIGALWFSFDYDTNMFSVGLGSTVGNQQTLVGSQIIPEYMRNNQYQLNPFMITFFTAQQYPKDPSQLNSSAWTYGTTVYCHGSADFMSCTGNSINPSVPSQECNRLVGNYNNPNSYCGTEGNITSPFCGCVNIAKFSPEWAKLIEINEKMGTPIPYKCWVPACLGQNADNVYVPPFPSKDQTCPSNVTICNTIIDNKGDIDIKDTKFYQACCSSDNIKKGVKGCGSSPKPNPDTPWYENKWLWIGLGVFIFVILILIVIVIAVKKGKTTSSVKKAAVQIFSG